MEVNGNLIRDLTHEEVVKMIRQSSVEDDVLHLTIVSKDQEVVV